MTFESAIKQLTDGRAAKYATWGGYIYRTDYAYIDVFSETSTYAVNDMVKKDNKTYICCLAVTTAGEWNEANWLKADRYTLTFRRRLNKEDGTPDDYPYTYTPKIKNGAVEYEVEPDGMNDGEISSTELAAMMRFDAAFLQALCTDSWTVGKTTDFEGIRLGTGKLW